MLYDALHFFVSARTDHELGICIQLVKEIFFTCHCRLVGNELYVVCSKLIVYRRIRFIPNCYGKPAFVVRVLRFFCHPFYEYHGCCLLICISICIDTEAVIFICRRVLCAVDGDGECEVSDIIRIFACSLHLRISPGTKDHGSHLSVVHHTFAALPVRCGVVVFCESVRHCIIKDLINVVRASAVSRISEGIFLMSQDLVFVLGISRGNHAYIVIPCTHGPAIRIVGVKRNGICVILDELQVCDKFFRCLGCFRDACFFKDFLVIQNAATYCCYRNAIHLAVIQPTVGIFYLLAYRFHIAVRQKVGRKIGTIYFRNHHDISPVAALQTKKRILCVIRYCLDLHMNVGIHLIEFCQILFPVLSAVIRIHHIRTVGEEFQIHRKICVVFSQSDVCIVQISLCCYRCTTYCCHGNCHNCCKTCCCCFFEFHVVVLLWNFKLFLLTL